MLMTDLLATRSPKKNTRRKHIRQSWFVLFVAFHGGCGSSLPKPSMDEDLRVGDHNFVSLPQVSDLCDPKTMPAYQYATPLARQILSGEEFSLANDTEALALLDSMLYASKPIVRRFYFLVVTKSLYRSDGYYSEGVGYWGSDYLIQHPKEFLGSWSECITMNEQRKWAWYLAAEENIGSEGYPTEIVMRDYVHRLDSVTKDLPGSLLNAKSSLLNTVDSIYRELAKDDRPISTSDEGY